MFGRDMPKPGPILSDQCLIFANLFMVRLSSRESVVVGESLVSCLAWSGQEGAIRLMLDNVSSAEVLVVLVVLECQASETQLFHCDESGSGMRRGLPGWEIGVVRALHHGVGGRHETPRLEKDVFCGVEVRILRGCSCGVGVLLRLSSQPEVTCGLQIQHPTTRETDSSACKLTI